MTVLIQKGLEIVPGYVLVRRLGSGMAGEVWIARASGGVHVAIKVIRDLQLIGSKRELGALRIVREVKHTNLCPLIGVWFFDRDGELLSSEETDAILGKEASLVDTKTMDTEGPSSNPISVCETESFQFGTDDLARTSAVSSSESDARPEEEEILNATQVVIAMGLGEKTLHDRLVEMRAPDNQPKDPKDPHHFAGGIEANELLRYIRGSASAIDELNQHHNIYHCDIKPQNILIVGGEAQVCDFGLARQVSDNRKTQLAFGTPAYGAPEMLFDHTYSKAIDQYSLAITYYELRSGKLPFESNRRSSFLRSKANGELDITAVPPSEQRVLFKATSLDPEDRYESCTAFATALSEAVFNPTDNRGNGAKQKTILLVSGILLAVLGVLGVGQVLRVRAAQEQKQAELERRENEQRSAEEKKEDNREAVSVPVKVEPPPDLPTLKVTWAKDLSPSEKLAEAEAVLAKWIDKKWGEPTSKQAGEFLAKVETLVPTYDPAGQITTVLSPEEQPGLVKLLERWQEFTEPYPVLEEEFRPGLAFFHLMLSLADPPANVDSKPNDRLNKQAQQVRSFFDASNQFALSSLSANASLAVASASASQPFDSVESFEVYVNDQLRTLQLHPQNPPRRAIASRHLADQLLTLEEVADGASDDQKSNKQRDKLALDISKALDIVPPISDGKSGWDRLPAETLVRARVAAGRVKWDQSLISDAIRLWLLASGDEKALVKNVEAKWRHAAATRLVPWLVDSSNVTEQNIDRIRFASMVSRARGVLGLAEKLTSDSPELSKQFDREEFLVAAATNDYAGGMQLWESLELSTGSDEFTPQMGHALFQLVSRRFPQATEADEKQRLLSLMVAASVSQASALLSSKDNQDSRFNVELIRSTDVVPLFVKTYRPTISALSEAIQLDPTELPQVPVELDEAGLVEFCQQYVDLATQSPCREESGDVLPWLHSVELAASIVAARSDDPDTRAQAALIACDAFLGALYEKNADVPPTTVLAGLKRYQTVASAEGDTSLAPFFAGRVAHKEAAQARDAKEKEAQSLKAIQQYSKIVDDKKLPSDLRGEVYGSRANVRVNIAILKSEEVRGDLLDLALADAREALGLPARWHRDNDERLEIATNVNLSVVRLLPKLSRAEKNILLEEADESIGQAIDDRKRQGLPVFRYANLQLNGYLLDMLNNGESSDRYRDRRGRATRLIERLMTKRLDNPTNPRVSLTLDTQSKRTLCHWHSMCAMVEDASGRFEDAKAQVQHAYDIAEEHLPATDDRRHQATLILVQFKSRALNPSQLDRGLIRELEKMLQTIQEPLPDFRAKKDLYLRELKAMG